MSGRPAPDRAAIDRAVEVLLRGGLVAFPTETVYGLGADAMQPAAVAAIFRAKGRPADHPLIVHIASADALAAWTSGVPAAASLLARRFWPGPLTLVLPRSARASDAVTGAQQTVGLRCPADPWAIELLRAFALRRGDPAAGIAAPSANLYGRISPTSAAHVRAELGEKPSGVVDLILDGGASEFGIESTIVDFPAGQPRVLRPGSIDRDALRAVVGAEVGLAGASADAPRASGRVEGHYAPAKPLEVMDADALAGWLQDFEGSAAVFAPAALLARVRPRRPLAAALPAPEEARAYAHVLYDALRCLDASGADRLLVARPPQAEAWAAVHDRLGRAAAGSGRPAG